LRDRVSPHGSWGCTSCGRRTRPPPATYAMPRRPGLAGANARALARLGRSRAGGRAARVARHQNPCRNVDERAQHQYTQDAKQSRDEGVDVVAAGEPGAYSRQEAALAWTREALLREPRPRASERVVVDIHLRLCGNGHSFFPFLPATARVICVRRACLPHAAPALRVAGGSPAANRRVFPKGHPGAEKGGSVGVIPTGDAEPPLAGLRHAGAARRCALEASPRLLSRSIKRCTGRLLWPRERKLRREGRLGVRVGCAPACLR
jgi:hypothetical protein